MFSSDMAGRLQVAKQRVYRDQLTTPWARFKFWLLLRRMRQVKLAAIWEAEMDKAFLESVYSEQLKHDDSRDRQALAEENRKPLDKQDRAVIDSLEQKIAMVEAIKKNHRKNEQFMEESRNYFDTIEAWKNLD